MGEKLSREGTPRDEEQQEAGDDRMASPPVPGTPDGGSHNFTNLLIFLHILSDPDIVRLKFHQRYSLRKTFIIKYKLNLTLSKLGKHKQRLKIR